MIGADYLFLLTDVDCLYTDNPRRFPETAKKVRIVRDIETLREMVSTSTMGSNLGTGGMETKIIAAELAIAAGVSTIITHGKKPQNILQILNNTFNLNISDEEYEKNTPLHTVFLPEEEPLTDKKWWVLHGLKPRGRIIIDEGAYRAIARSTVNASNSSSTTPQARTPPLASSSSTSNSLPSTPLSQCTTSTTATTTTQQPESAVPSPSLLASSSARPISIPRSSSTSNNTSSSGNGGRLLPAGVIAVEGTFAAGQAVTVVVQRKRRRNRSDLYTSSSSASASANASANMTRGRRGSQNNASRSGSSSLANSLILEQAKQIGDPYDISEEQYHQSRSSSPSLKEISTTKSFKEKDRARKKKLEMKITANMSDTDIGNDTTTDDDDSNEIEEQIEFGRGLANYNYDEIDRIKGHKR